MANQDFAGSDELPTSRVIPAVTLRIPMPRGAAIPPLADAAKLRSYRDFLGLTQAELAAKLDRTQNSLAAWEAGSSTVPSMDMAHVRQIVVGRVMEQTRGLFKALKPSLAPADLDGIFSAPDADIRFDSQGNRYLGLVFIDGYRKHTLQMRLDDQKWYGIDEDGNATLVDEAFLDSVIKFGEGRLT